MSHSPSDLPLAGAAPPHSRATSTPAAATRPMASLAEHDGLPLLALAVVFCVWSIAHGDLWLADRLYAWEGNAWTLRHARATQQLIHLLGRDFSAMAWLAVFAAWLVAWRRVGLAALRKPLLYLLAATAVSSLLVAWIKSWSNIDCPWDLARYGGTRPFVELFEPRPAGLGRGVCFPAGHASAGYAWLALYFFLRVVKPQLRWIGLGIGIGAGLLFGISQQLRGAHFLSHDIATAAICWACAMALHAVFWRSPREPRTARQDSAAGVPAE